ncbi:hypothetical protein V8C43DRAFT_286761 [Trichoderma afarasin]
MCKNGYEHRLAEAQTRTRAPNRRDCRRESPAHRHDATAAAGGSTCPRAEMDGLIALSCMTEAAENGKEGHPRQGAWPCRSPWPGSAPLLGPLPEHSMRSPVVVSRIGQGLRGGGERRLCQIRRIRTQWALSSGPVRLGAMLCWAFSVINANSCTSCRRFWLPVASCY